MFYENILIFLSKIHLILSHPDSLCSLLFTRCRNLPEVEHLLRLHPEISQASQAEKLLLVLLSSQDILNGWKWWKRTTGRLTWFSSRKTGGRVNKSFIKKESDTTHYVQQTPIHVAGCKADLFKQVSFHRMKGLVESSIHVNAVYLGLAKAFNLMAYVGIIKKHALYGIKRMHFGRTKSWLTDRSQSGESNEGNYFQQIPTRISSWYNIV